MPARFTSYRGVGLLVVAALLVAVAILTSGPVSRGINGVGGILWLVGLIMVWRVLGAGNRSLVRVGAALALTLVLVLLIKPSDLSSAALGFGLAGMALGLLARHREMLWAAMIPALWLPIHLGIAISRAVLDIGRDQAAAVRTDPPPTEAFVPLMMVVAALAGGLLAARFRSLVWSSRRNSTENRQSSNA